MAITPENVTPVDIRKIQDVILDILVNIDRTATSHGLDYYLIAGTMLGAVRHKGFIPWDDDADVALPRPDYERLIQHAPEWLPPHLELVSYKSDPTYPYQFARIHNRQTTYCMRRSFGYIGGVPVDIFPLDGMTDDSPLQRAHYRHYHAGIKKLYYSLVDPHKHGYGLRWCFIKTMQHMFHPGFQHGHLDAIQREFDYETSPLVADHDNKPDRGIYDKAVFGSPTPVEFEGHRLMGVSDPHKYLTICYGDYMTPPATRPPLNFRYIDLDKPYREFIAETQNLKK